MTLQGRPENRRALPGLRYAAAAIFCGLLGYLAFAFLPMLTGAGQNAAPLQEGAIPATSSSQPPGPPAAATPPPTATPLATLPAGPPAAPPQRLIYPAAGIDVAVLPLSPESFDTGARTITPPATMEGYWLTPYGMPGAGSANTTYVAGHSWEDREAPFNRLSTQAAAGHLLTVATAAGSVEYRVDSVATYVKSGLKDSQIWEVVPHRLVLISCYTGDLWGTNVVVVASPARQ